MTLEKKINLPVEVTSCKSFDEILENGYFERLSESQMIESYNYFLVREKEEKALKYADWEESKRFCKNDFRISVEGADTTVSELLEEGYKVRYCKDAKKIIGIASWFDERDWQYLGLIYVDPLFRGKGIMGGLIDDGYDGKPIVTKVHSGNNIAVKSFEKYGFNIEKREGDFFKLIRG